MSAQTGPRTFTMHRWLALALLVTFLVPVCVIVAFAVAAVGERPHDKQDDAVEQIRDGAALWNDHAWRETTAADFADDGVAFILVVDGRELYRSTEDPFTNAGDRQKSRVVERVVIPNSSPEQIAYIYVDDENGPPDEVPVEFIPVIGLVTLGLTLAGIAWFLGRIILRPLAATSQAARQVASGDLDISLPRSRVREVDDVNIAFDAMSAALRTSLEEQAELEQERRLFIGAVAHDLRTPLFALRGYLEGIESGVASTPEQRARYVSVAREKADDLERLISDLFAYSRLEYLEQAPQREPLDLTALLGRLADEMQPLASMKGVSIAIAATEPCGVIGDSHLLTRAIANLLDNAIRFTPEGGSVTLSCERAGQTVSFTVADTGPGIPPDDLPDIFNPLFRGESSRNRRTGGAGLGLTIARRIMLAHGGDLTAANRPDGGAVFSGTIPNDERPPAQ